MKVQVDRLQKDDRYLEELARQKYGFIREGEKVTGLKNEIRRCDLQTTRRNPQPHSQIAVGCSHNRCTFCGSFKDKKFRVKSFEEIKEDVNEAKAFAKHVNKFFLLTETP